MQELRPLATALCVTINRSAREKSANDTSNINAYTSASKSDTEHIESSETQSLCVEKLLLDLFTHKCLEKSSKQVQHDFEQILKKVEIHSQSEKAKQMRVLANDFDRKMLQLLMELSCHPSRQSECIDLEMEETVTEVVEDQSLVPDLIEIACEDAWFGDWTDSADEDEEMDLTSRLSSNQSFNDDDELNQLMKDPTIAFDSSLEGIDAFNQRRQNRLLQRYYGVDKKSENNTLQNAFDLKLATELCEDIPSSRPFQMSDPCTLFRSINVAEKPAITLIREQVLVDAVFHVLLGIPSDIFEFIECASDTSACQSERGFLKDTLFETAQLTARAKHTAVPHLSLKALHHLLEFFAANASNFCYLRRFQSFVQRDTFAFASKSVVLEGFSAAISTIICSVNQCIVRVQMRFIKEQKLDQKSSNDLDTRLLHSTLLSIRVELHSSLQSIKWLSVLVRKCIEPFDTPRHSTEPGRIAVTILNTLYEILQQESLTHPARALMDDNGIDIEEEISHFDTCFRLFKSALEPYLDLLERMFFRTSFTECIPTHSEMFVGYTAEPKTISDRYLIDSQLFTVRTEVVPVFLHDLVPALEEAITSRCILNTFRQQSFPNESPQAGHFDLTINETDRVLLPFSRWMESHVIAPVAQKCATLNGEIASLFRTELCLLERIKSLRYLVLMLQPEMCHKLCEYLLERMSRYSAAWTDRQALNAHFQESLEDLHNDRLISEAMYRFGSELYIHLNAQALADATMHSFSMETPSILRPYIKECKMDIQSISILTFSLEIAPPLHLLLGKSLLVKYSQLAVFIMQTKVVQVALSAIQHRLQRRTDLDRQMSVSHVWRLQLASMWHYTKCFQLYLQSQVTSRLWKETKTHMEQAISLSAMRQTQMKYVDQLLERFFLLEKHHMLHQYITASFNHILSFVHDFQSILSLCTASLSPENEQIAHKILQERMMKTTCQWRHKVHFQIVTLGAMFKHSRSPHIQNLYTSLNYNCFYSQREYDATEINSKYPSKSFVRDTRESLGSHKENLYSPYQRA
ncbi:unnamed protein product [Albugo candida]|nr:unnamed protein product [Albugo candida]|eukprot:CCI46247.1 unnamed protein product [Albugo candida]